MDSTRGKVSLVIDDTPVEVDAWTTIYDAACKAGIEIPKLCHEGDKNPVGVCRICVVELEQRVKDKDGYKNKYDKKPYPAACIRELSPNEDQGLIVKTSSDGVKMARKVLLQLLMADHHAPCKRQNCELEELAAHYHITESPFPHREVPARPNDPTYPIDESSHSILVDHKACILCDRCVRACADVKQHYVITREGKGYEAGITFDLGKSMGDSSCVSCGECMFSCPTGALTNIVYIDQDLASRFDDTARSVSIEELQTIPMFRHISTTFLDFNRNCVAELRFNAGDYIFYEGVSDDTAYYLKEGQVRILKHCHHERPIEKNKGLVNTWQGKIANLLKHKSSKHQPFLCCDESNQHEITKIHPGHLFGEMACLSSYPRSASAQAATDCVVLVMLRNVLDMLRRNKQIRTEMDQEYCRRALDTQLPSSRFLSMLPEDYRRALHDKLQLIRCQPGQVIFSEGDESDAVYLIRLGFVKVSSSSVRGEFVLTYLREGDYFGEVGVLRNEKRAISCSAADHVDLVRIPAADFIDMYQSFDELRLELESTLRQREIDREERLKRISSVSADQIDDLAEFTRQKLEGAQNLLVLDLDRCTRCDQCVRACAETHRGVPRMVRDGMRFKRHLVVTACRHCYDPLCMVGCPVDAIHRHNTLAVSINDRCIGCGLCEKNCPYGSIKMHELAKDDDFLADMIRMGASADIVRKRVATSCDLCEGYDEPNCVYACPHDAAFRVDPASYFGGEVENKAKKS